MNHAGGDTQQTNRCAIYTRKSSEAGLEQSFNSLHAQREACEAYIKSQAHEGWKLRPTQYDDGGLSGGTLERPALHRLIADIRDGLIDVVVVYKVDRLSRSLADFARLVELFEEYSVSFVSVTQHFNTSSSMGRLTLNVLLSFAQFEREVTGERIRDKIAASKKKGMWMGGRVPLGFDVVDKRLVVNEPEAATVRHIYERYLALGCVRLLKAELDAGGLVSKIQKNGIGGKPFSRGALYTLLRNPVYVGDVRHKGEVYAGEHAAILERAAWDQVQKQLQRNRSRAKRRSAAKAPSLLAGLLFDSNGHPMSPTHATKAQKRYRYYISQSVLKYVEKDGGSVLRVPASSVESVVIDQISELLKNPTRMLEEMQKHDVPEEAWEGLLSRADSFAEEWVGSDPHEKTRILQRVLTRVELKQERIESHVNFAGILHCLLPNDPDSSQQRANSSTDFVVATPVRLKRCGVETRLVAANGQEESAHPDSVKAIRTALKKAHQWNQMLLDGKAKTLTTLARREKCDPRYLSDLIRLAYLAPDIQNAIVTGRVPTDLTLDKLKKSVSADWNDQRLWLGFNT